MQHQSSNNSTTVTSSSKYQQQPQETITTAASLRWVLGSVVVRSQSANTHMSIPPSVSTESRDIIIATRTGQTVTTTTLTALAVTVIHISDPEGVPHPFTSMVAMWISRTSSSKAAAVEANIPANIVDHGLVHVQSSSFQLNVAVSLDTRMVIAASMDLALVPSAAYVHPMAATGYRSTTTFTVQ